MFPKSTHETFAQKMYQTYKAHKRFSKPKLARTAFTINHYAGDVSTKLLSHKFIKISTNSNCLQCNRLHTKQTSFLIRTKIMLWQSTKHCWMLQNAPLLRICSLHCLKNLLNSPSSRLLVHDLRYILAINLSEL